MKYLFDFKDFDEVLFENTKTNITTLEKDLKKFDLNLEDESIQKIICDELYKKIENSTDKLDLRIDASDVAKRASTVPQSTPISSPSSALSRKESKIYESNSSDDEFKDSLKIIQDKLKESDIEELNEENILRKMEAEEFGEDAPDDLTPNEKKESWLDSVKAALNWLKQNKFAKGVIWVILKIIKVILWLPRFIFRLLRSLFNWFLRVVLGFSHESTSKTSKLVFPILSLCFIVFIFVPLITTGVLVFSGVSIITAMASFSVPSIASTSLLFRGLYRLFSSWIGVYLLEPKSFRNWKKDDEEIFTFLEYLDELEKISGKRFKIDLDTRKAIEKLDTSMGRERHLPVFGKRESKFNPYEISDWLKRDIAKIKKLTQQNGFTRVKINIPVFSKIVDNQTVTKEDLKSLQDFFTSTEDQGLYRYRGKSSLKLEY